jgi:hypothetical protein
MCYTSIEVPRLPKTKTQKKVSRSPFFSPRQPRRPGETIKGSVRARAHGPPRHNITSSFAAARRKTYLDISDSKLQWISLRLKQTINKQRRVGYVDLVASVYLVGWLCAGVDGLEITDHRVQTASTIEVDVSSYNSTIILLV